MNRLSYWRKSVRADYNRNILCCRAERPVPVAFSSSSRPAFSLRTPSWLKLCVLRDEASSSLVVACCECWSTGAGNRHGHRAKKIVQIYLSPPLAPRLQNRLEPNDCDRYTLSFFPSLFLFLHYERSLAVTKKLKKFAGIPHQCAVARHAIVDR